MDTSFNIYTTRSVPPRFLSGMGHVGTFMMAFNLALEFVGMKYRTMFGILIETPFALGGLIVGIVSYAGVRDWRTLTLGGSQTHYDLQTWGTVFSAVLSRYVSFLHLFLFSFNLI